MFRQNPDDDRNEDSPYHDEPSPSPTAPSNAWTSEDEAAARAYFFDYMSKHQILNLWGTVDDAFNAYVKQRQNGLSHTDALPGALHMLGWDHDLPDTPAPPPPPPPPPPKPPAPPAPGLPTIPGLGPGQLLTPFTEQFPAPAAFYPSGSSLAPGTPGMGDPGPSPVYQSPGLPPPPPVFQGPPLPPAPPPFLFADFELPTGQEALTEDPGYAFRVNQGLQALTNSAAAKHSLRTGATLKNFIDYGQQLGSQEYGNVVDRRFNVWNANRGNALQAYNTNYGTQYVDPYNRAVDKSKLEFNTNYTTQVVDPYNRAVDKAKLDWQHGFDVWNEDFNIFKWNKTFPYTVLHDQQLLGLDAASRA